MFSAIAASSFAHTAIKLSSSISELLGFPEFSGFHKQTSVNVYAILTEAKVCYLEAITQIFSQNLSKHLKISVTNKKLQRSTHRHVNCQCYFSCFYKVMPTIHRATPSM